MESEFLDSTPRNGSSRIWEPFLQGNHINENIIFTYVYWNMSVGYNEKGIKIL